MSGLLLALDFDGTIAPISPDPEQVAIDPEARDFLAAASSSGASVAIVSGRDVDDLAGRIGDLAVWLAGSHGLDIRSPDGRMIREQPPLAAELEASIAADALRLGMRLERKKHAIALHWRETGDSAEVASVADAFRRWAATLALDVIDGRAVIEARTPGGGKADAVRLLCTQTGASRVIYAGDDLTDFEALELALGRGRAFFVASDEREPPPMVTTVTSTHELIERLRSELRGQG